MRLEKPTVVTVLIWLLGLSFFTGVAWSKIQAHDVELTIATSQRFEYLIQIDQRLSRIEGHLGVGN